MPQTYYRAICGAAYYGEEKQFQDWKGVKAGVFGYETCPKTKRIHAQYTLFFRTGKRFTTIKKKFKKLHFEDVKHFEKSIQYCKKGEQSHQEWESKGNQGPNYGRDAKVTEWGTYPQQGARGDLMDLKDQIVNGESTVTDILLDNPMMYHKFGRTLEKIQQYRYKLMFRTVQTTCTWYIGPTGVGKSHKAFDGYHPLTHYLYPKDLHWWDNYEMEETVIINEFRAEIKFGKMLELLDKWPCVVPRRGQCPRPFLTKHVIITSLLHPSEIYCNVSERDDFKQLLRRINIVHLEADGRTPRSVLPVATSVPFSEEKKRTKCPPFGELKLRSEQHE